MQRKKQNWFSRGCYWVIFRLVRLVYPKIQVVGTLPEDPCIVVGNHAHNHGPIFSELYFPRNRYTWCASQMTNLKEVPGYAYDDFWRNKPKLLKPMYKLFSYLIAPLSVCLFNNAQTIPVYRDTRIIATFKETVQRLNEGSDVVILPEGRTPHNHIIQDFQDKFIDVARLYYKRTGKEIAFVPMYVAPDLKQTHLGKPITYHADQPPEEERQRIKEHLMNEITQIAVNLPRHTVVPYSNIPKKDYPCNIPEIDSVYEKTGG